MDSPTFGRFTFPLFVFLGIDEYPLCVYRVFAVFLFSVLVPAGRCWRVMLSNIPAKTRNCQEIDGETTPTVGQDEEPCALHLLLQTTLVCLSVALASGLKTKIQKRVRAPVSGSEKPSD